MVELARLERVCTARYPGFKSLSLRHRNFKTPPYRWGVSLILACGDSDENQQPAAENRDPETVQH